MRPIYMRKVSRLCFCRFFIIWFFLYFYFLDISFNNTTNKKKWGIDTVLLKKIFSSFFKKYLYYIWLSLFYVGLYLVIYNYWFTDFSYIIFFINIIVLVLFFIKHKLAIFRDFIKINIILFSIYYLFLFILFFINWNDFFNLYDLINGFTIFIFFLLSFYTDKKILKKEKSDKAVVFYFFLYTFLLFWFYLNKLIWENLLLLDRKSTRLNSSHPVISYAVFCLNKKNNITFNSYYTYYT